jgi:hypothetical protein
MTDAQNREIIPSYPYMTAGRTWIIPNVYLSTAPDGEVIISGAEIHRMQTIVANEVCGQASTLSPDEFEFLCDITGTKFNEVAEFLGVTKGSITFWKRPGKIVPLNESLRLKRWFWRKVFESHLAKAQPFSIPSLVLLDDGQLLSFLRDQGKVYTEEERNAG